MVATHQTVRGPAECSKMVGEILNEYGPVIRAKIRSRVNDHEADDIFQNFFLSLLYKPVPAHIQDVRNYLGRAVANDVFDACRQAQGYRARIRRYAQWHCCCAAEKSPDEAAASNEEVEKLLQIAEEQLSRREAEAIIYHYGHGHSGPDAAKKMGVTSRTLSRYLCVGLKKMRNVVASNKQSFGKPV